MEPSTGRGEAPCAKPLACRGTTLYFKSDKGVARGSRGADARLAATMAVTTSVFRLVCRARIFYVPCSVRTTGERPWSPLRDAVKGRVPNPSHAVAPPRA